MERQGEVFLGFGTHNGCRADFRRFTEATVAFFNEALPQGQEAIVNFVTDIFRVITDD